MQLPLHTSQRFKFNDSAQRIEGSFWLRNDGGGGPSAAAEKELPALPAATLTASPFDAGASIATSVVGTGALQVVLHRPLQPPLRMVSADGEAADLLQARGGYATVRGCDGCGVSHSWRLNCVIAADADDAGGGTAGHALV